MVKVMRFINILVILFLCSCGDKENKQDLEATTGVKNQVKDLEKNQQKAPKPSPKDHKKVTTPQITKDPVKNPPPPVTTPPITKDPVKNPLPPVKKPIDPAFLKALDKLDKKEFFTNVVGISVSDLEDKYKDYLGKLDKMRQEGYFDDLSLLDDLSKIKVTDKDTNTEIPLSYKILLDLSVNWDGTNNNSHFTFPVEDKENQTTWFIMGEIKKKLSTDNKEIKTLVAETVKNPSSLDDARRMRIVSIIRGLEVKPENVLTKYEKWFDDKPWFKHGSVTYEFIKNNLENFKQELKKDIQAKAQKISDSIDDNTPKFEALINDDLVKLGLHGQFAKNKYTIPVYAEALNNLFKAKARADAKNLYKNNANVKKLYDEISDAVADALFDQMTIDLKAGNLEEKLIKPLASILVEVNASSPEIGKLLYDDFFGKPAQRNNIEFKAMYDGGYITALRNALTKAAVKDSVLYDKSPDIILETGRIIR